MMDGEAKKIIMASIKSYVERCDGCKYADAIKVYGAHAIDEAAMKGVIVKRKVEQDAPGVYSYRLYAVKQ
jgi:hypothetical protein